MSNNSLNVNPSKSKAIFISRHNDNKLKVVYNDVVIDFVVNFNFNLGIVIDSKMNFDFHVIDVLKYA